MSTGCQLRKTPKVSEREERERERQTKFCGPETVSMQKPPPGGRLRSAEGAMCTMSSIAILSMDGLAGKLEPLLSVNMTCLE
jgi:hypothetical protein